MKKMLAMVLGLLLAAVAPMGAFAESPLNAVKNLLEQDPLPPFEGLVTEVFEGGFMLEDIQMGLMQVNTDDNTVWDGILSIQPIEAGMYVIVDHSGMMTRSIPPQVYGVRVGCYTLSGVAGDITEEGVLLTGDPIFGDVFVQMTSTMTTVFPGAPMLVYYDGVMTMSLPGKVNARYVVVPELTGVVSETDGAGFTLTDAEGNSYRILTSDSLLVGELTEAVEELLADEAVAVEDAMATEEAVVEVAEDMAAAGEAVVDGEEAAADVEGAAVADEEAAAADEEAAGDEVVTMVITDEKSNGIASEEAAALPVIEWGDGDTVTVYHQGPIEAEAGAELVALGLIVHR